MKLKIFAQKPDIISLTLTDNDAIIDCLEFSFDRDLDTDLIRHIDIFFKRNKIDPLSLKSVRVVSGALNDSLASKIMQACQVAIKAVKTSNSQGK